jgi:hydroxymethylpyrimidine pyrophosphatase-like HAD family hydrolase
MQQCCLRPGIRSLCYSGSGRPTPAMIAYAKELQLDNSYMISYNGAVITDLKEDKVILSKR